MSGESTYLSYFYGSYDFLTKPTIEPFGKLLLFQKRFKTKRQNIPKTFNCTLLEIIYQLKIDGVQFDKIPTKFSDYEQNNDQINKITKYPNDFKIDGVHQKSSSLIMYCI